jgi:ABC-type lipoprotein export system ATPase subunit
MSLSLKSIKKSFFQGETQIEVLKNLNAEIQTGEVVAILGKSGSGKSTLLSVLAGNIKIDTGEIHLDGKNKTGLSDKKQISRGFKN